MKIVTSGERPPVTIEFTYEEAKALRTAVLADLTWSETEHEDLWEAFESVLAKAVK